MDLKSVTCPIFQEFHELGQGEKGPIFEKLRSDYCIQANTQKRLHTYGNDPHHDNRGKATDTFKSGRFRVGIHRVVHVIALAPGLLHSRGWLKQPTYKDLMVLHWSHRFMFCA